MSIDLQKTSYEKATIIEGFQIIRKKDTQKVTGSVSYRKTYKMYNKMTDKL